jgi:hypothetical protein
MKGMEIPGALDPKLTAEFYTTQTRRPGNPFPLADLRPGDQIWLKNPYYRPVIADLNRRIQNAMDDATKKLLQDQIESMDGEGGSNVFMATGQKLMAIYARRTRTLFQYQNSMMRYQSVQYAIQHPELNLHPKPEDFEILERNVPTIPEP